MIVPDMPVPAGVQDPLDGPYLLFTANLDGDLDSWLEQLAAGSRPRRRRSGGAASAARARPRARR